MVEPSSETLQGAASDLYDDLKQTGAGYVDETEEFLEEYFPEIFGSTDEDEVDPFGEPAELTLERVKGKGKNKGGKHGPVKGNGTEPDSPDHLSPFGIFSEPLITSLLVTFVVFVPLVGFGIMAMSSIQVSCSRACAMIVLVLTCAVPFSSCQVPPHLLSTAKTSGPSQAKKEQ